MTSKEFVQHINELVKKQNMFNNNKLATVTQIISGRPYVTFDGETAQSGIRYAYTSGLTFSVGDRVHMQAINGKYFISSKITA